MHNPLVTQNGQAKFNLWKTSKPRKFHHNFRIWQEIKLLNQIKNSHEICIMQVLSGDSMSNQTEIQFNGDWTKLYYETNWAKPNWYKSVLFSSVTRLLNQTTSEADAVLLCLPQTNLKSHEQSE